MAVQPSPAVIAQEVGKAERRKRNGRRKPAVSSVQSRPLSHRFDRCGQAALVARGLVLVDDSLVGDAVNDA
jgi:hypothetical protein